MPRPRGALALPLAFAAAAFVLLLVPGVVGPYGLFIDELYYLSCAKRLAWGYVDHPPLSIGLLALWRALIGDDLLALRIPAAAAGALAVAGSGLLARRLGAGRTGQAIACAAVLLSPGLYVMSSSYSMNGLEILLWLAGLWLLAEIELADAPRLWLAVGVVVGLAFENKHTAIVLFAAVGLALPLTPARARLASPWPWLGVAVAALLAVPNLLWQVAHGWPSLEFYRNAALEKNLPASPLAVAAGVALFFGPVTLPVMVVGLVHVVRRRDLRHLALAALAVVGLLVVSRQSRPDRVAGLAPFFCAAGGAVLGRWLPAVARRGRLAVAGVAALALLLVAALAPVVPLAVPLWPPHAAADHAAALGLSMQLERGEGKRSRLPQWLADRLGWELLAEDVTRARDRLSPEEQRRVVFFAPSYGQAGVLDRLGLGPVYCTHNNWFFWGPPADPVDVAIVLDEDRETLATLFEEVEPAGVYDCDLCMPWRDEMPIWIVRRARGSIAARWPRWRHFE